jgi:hypothetical protein
MPGMTGNQWFDNTDLDRSEGGLLKADISCRSCVSSPNKNSNIGPPRIALGSFGLPEKPMAVNLSTIFLLNVWKCFDNVVFFVFYFNTLYHYPCSCVSINKCSPSLQTPSTKKFGQGFPP